MTPQPPRIAIAQIAMHWTIADNLAAIERALALAAGQGAQICAFAELAITGYHREIARETQAEPLRAALAQLQSLCARWRIAIAVGAPHVEGAVRHLAHHLIDETGRLVATVFKRGLTEPERLFFTPGDGRPVGLLHAWPASAVLCREVEDHEQIGAELPPGRAALVFLPGALRPDPAKPRTDPPGFLIDAQRLALRLRAHVVQTNWPNALNRPEESVDGGGSAVLSPAGEILLRLPMQASGLGLFTLGERHHDWHPL